jgi:Flp pilus assembly protein TadB
MIHWGELLALTRLSSTADATNAELRGIREELETTRREQEREREERRRAALTPKQRADEDRQKCEAEAKRQAWEQEQRLQAWKDRKKKRRDNLLAFFIASAGAVYLHNYAPSWDGLFALLFTAAFLSGVMLAGVWIEKIIADKWGRKRWRD